MSVKVSLNPDSLYWASFNRFELRLPGQCVLDCSHSCPCDSDVAYWVPKVQAQIAADNFQRGPDAELIRQELSEFGAWSNEELQDTEQNLHRLVWIAAGNIAEDENPDCSEPVKPITKESVAVTPDRVTVLALPDYLQFISDSQDVKPIEEHFGIEAGTFGSYFVRVQDGDYCEVWGIDGIIPNLDKVATRVL